MTSPGQMFELSPSEGGRMQRTLADQLAVQLHQAILRGEYESGSWLRIRDIAEQYQTSAMPVREVLRRLDALGLVEVVPHRGARVAELSVADLEDTYQTRRALETALIGLAASRFTSAYADAAAEALTRHEQLIKSGDVDEARRAHTEFHFGIYRASGSRWLVRSLEPAWQNSERYRFTSPGDPRSSESSHEEHSEILAACVAKDEARAEAAIGRHLDGALERIRRAMLA